MKPFTVSTLAQQLKTDFLQPSDFVAISKQLEQSEISGILRHWLMEGTPYIFSNMPMLYEGIREWLSWRLKINPLEIKLVGSARTGFSMSPSPKFGKLFNEKSDLDIAVISDSLFLDCKITFEQWKVDYQQFAVRPRNANEKMFWDENITVVTNSIKRGFLDSNKIPSLDRYPVAQNISQTMWLLKSKLDISSFAPTVRKTSIRIYRDWTSFHKQVKTNFLASNISNNTLTQ